MLSLCPPLPPRSPFSRAGERGGVSTRRPSASKREQEAKEHTANSFLSLFFFCRSAASLSLSVSTSCLAPRGRRLRLARQARSLLAPSPPGASARRGRGSALVGSPRARPRGAARGGVAHVDLREKRAMGIRKKRRAAAASFFPVVAARRFRQHPPLGFLSPPRLFPFCLSFPFSKKKQKQNAGRQAEGLPRGQPRPLQGRARGEQKDVFSFLRSFLSLSLFSFLSLSSLTTSTPRRLPKTPKNTTLSTISNRPTSARSRRPSTTSRPPASRAPPAPRPRRSPSASRTPRRPRPLRAVRRSNWRGQSGFWACSPAWPTRR